MIYLMMLCLGIYVRISYDKDENSLKLSYDLMYDM